MGKLHINILGTSFSIKASEDDEYLSKLSGYYTKLVEEIQKSGMLKSGLDISILAGIMLCDELYKEKAKNAVSDSTLPHAQDSKESEKAQILTQKMINQLDSVLKKQD